MAIKRQKYDNLNMNCEILEWYDKQCLFKS